MMHERYLRIPYRHEGRDWDGCDCFGLVRLFYAEELGITLEDVHGYPEDWSSLGLDCLMSGAAGMGFVPHEGTPIRGDVVIFRINSVVSHIGICLNPDEGWFLHCGTGGVSLHNYFTDGAWSRRLGGFYRYAHTV